MTAEKKVRSELSPLHYLDVIHRRLWVILIPVICVSVTVLISNLFQASVYEAGATMRVRDADAKLNMFINPLGVNLSTEAEFLKSRSVLNAVVEKLKTEERFEKYREQEHFDEDLKGMRGSVRTHKLGPDVNMIGVSVSGHIPEMVRDVANTLMETAVELNLAYKRRDAKQTRAYIEQQQVVVAGRLREADEKLRQFQVANKQMDMKMQIESPYLDPLGAVDPLARVESEMMPLREKVAALSKIYNDDYPELQQAKSELAVRERYMQKLTQNIKLLPDKKSEYIGYLREMQIYQKDYENLARVAQEARLKEVAVVSDYDIVDSATTPTVPIAPKPVQNTILGVIVGFVLGVLLAFLIEYLDDSVRTSDEIEQKLSVPVLGEIPYINLQLEKEKTLKRLKAKVLSDDSTGMAAYDFQDISERLVSQLMPKSPATEAYRQLYVNLNYARSDDKPIKMITVSSPGPGEGKSSISSNLALVAASLGRRTILVDCDLRKPVVHKIFNLEQESGVGDIFQDMTDWKLFVKNTDIDNFSVITAGHLPLAPMLLFNSVRFQTMLDELKEAYDLVILDTPPINGLTDSSILSSKVDGVLMVVCQGKTSRESAIHAKQLLENVNAVIIGAIINSVTENHTYGYYSYYRYGYGYGYGYGGYYSHDSESSNVEKSIIGRLINVASKNGVLKKINRLYKKV